MSTTRLVTQDSVEQQILDLLWRRHPEHLALLERSLGLAPATIERLKTCTLLTGAGQSFKENDFPAVLLAMNTLTSFERRRGGGREILFETYTLDMDVTVMGGGAGTDTIRSDAMRRLRWTTHTIAECLLQRLPRACDPVESITEQAPWEFEIVDGSSGIGRAELSFTVVLSDAMTITGGPLPIDDPSQPPSGGPGGAPNEPYDPLHPWPPATELDLTVERRSLT